MGRLKQYGLAFLLLASPLKSAGAELGNSCQLVRVASAKMSIDQGEVSVPMSVGGRTITAVVNTLSKSSLLDYATALSLHLSTIDSRMRPLFGHGQMTFTDLVDDTRYTWTTVYAVVPDTVLGGWPPVKRVFFVIQNGFLHAPYNGVVGTDILEKFDVEFDFSNGVFNLFSQKHCPGQIVYWTKQPAARIPFEIDQNGHITVPIDLDGRAMRAIIATSTSKTVASFDRLGSDFSFDAQTSGVRAEPTIDGKGETYRYPFKMLSFEGVTIQNPDIAMMPGPTPGVSKDLDAIVLGTDVLKRFHLYIAYEEKALYLTAASAH